MGKLYEQKHKPRRNMSGRVTYCTDRNRKEVITAAGNTGADNLGNRTGEKK